MGFVAPTDDLLKEINDLRLEVQELRQCLAQILLVVRNTALSEEYVDFWWPKLTRYPEVQKDPA